MWRPCWVGTIVVVVVSAVTAQASEPKTPRSDAIARATVWFPTDIAAKDLWRGPDDPDGFAPLQTVSCEYVNKVLSGNTPKFACRLANGDEVKVKYGGTNGEVYGEVLATRLLWALGFPADRMYPVRIACRACPETMAGIKKSNGDLLVDPASIERKYPGKEIGANGWAWPELDDVSDEPRGAPRAHRDALKLLAAFLQHTDSKSQQQRLVCLEPAIDGASCAVPVMMLNDVGRTFGRASRTNANVPSSVNLQAWSETPVWKDGPGCVARLSRSFTGTLHDPVIGEKGREFLASLLQQLSDKQLHDLFAVARVELRPRVPDRGRSGFPTVDEWVDAFKAKRAAVVERHCE